MKKPRIKAGIGKPKRNAIGGIGPPKNKGFKQGFRPSPMGAAPVGPTAPSSPPVASPTGDYRYLEAQNQYNTRFNDANLALQNKQYQVESDYGFDTTRFAQNPYTRANLLAQRAKQRFNTTTNAMAGRGQLYSGALNRARVADEFTSGQELDTTRKEYSQALAAIEQEKLAAQRDRDEGLSGAYGDYLDRLLEREPDAGLFSEEEAGGGGGAGGGKGGKKGGGSKKGGKKPAAKGGFRAVFKSGSYKKPSGGGGKKKK